MSALEEFEAVLAEMEALHRENWCICRSSSLPQKVETSLRDLLAQHRALLADMKQRELHHFETERAMSDALGVLRSASVPLGMSEANFHRLILGRAARILYEAVS